MEINYSTKQATGERCKVTELSVSPETVRFEREDEALPMPIDDKAQPALKLAPILDDLDRYELRVSGLPSGTYELSIDSERVGSATSEELARGWNLAALPGPVKQQTQRVLSLVVQKNNLYYTRWRTVQLYSFPDWAKSSDNEQRRADQLAKMDAEIQDLERAIDQARRPSAHRFELKLQAR